jgi:hypothetical protein
LAPITSSRFSAFIAFAFYTGEQQQEEKESRLQFIWMLVKTWSMKLYSFLSKEARQLFQSARRQPSMFTLHFFPLWLYYIYKREKLCPIAYIFF